MNQSPLLNAMKMYSNSAMGANQWNWRTDPRVAQAWQQHYLTQHYGNTQQGQMGTPRIDVTNWNNTVNTPAPQQQTPGNYTYNPVVNVSAPPTAPATQGPAVQQPQPPAPQTQMVWDPRTGSWSAVAPGTSPYGGNNTAAGNPNPYGGPNPIGYDFGGGIRANTPFNNP